MCERVLRGTRGQFERFEGRDVSVRDAEPGRDVKVSIDIELQQAVQALFQNVPVSSKTADDQEVTDRLPMHGAAVVIDVASGEVLAMASAPGFDVNRLDEQYAALTSPDNFDEPLLNRATQTPREPGSTVKPMVGLAGVASNVRQVDDKYECIGYMVLNGRVFPRQGRCWVNSKWHNALCPLGASCTRVPCPAVAHHVVPSAIPHPTGFLTLPDALERSCNPYFESLAQALGPERLSDWFQKFGLGRRTYIGIAEARGSVPMDGVVGHSPNTLLATWTAGIGQGPVQATPLQMANVAATLARDGVWVRPRLIHADSAKIVGPTTRLADRVDLGLPPEALRAVREGMVRVVNSKAGTGRAAERADMLVAGKTGSAQAASLRRKIFDPMTKKQARDEKRRLLWGEEIRPSIHSNPNPDAPWYRDTGREGSDRPTLTHSWYIGYAPADKPQVAFAVMIEYGGAGGSAAGSVAKDIIELCKGHGYIKLSGQPNTGIAAAPQPPRELLHEVR
jgi:penicillin-binding protein 2